MISSKVLVMDFSLFPLLDLLFSSFILPLLPLYRTHYKHLIRHIHYFPCFLFIALSIQIYSSYISFFSSHLSPFTSFLFFFFISITSNHFSPFLFFHYLIPSLLSTSCYLFFSYLHLFISSHTSHYILSLSLYFIP